MECKKCGKILSEQERFCTYCGYYNDPNEIDEEQVKEIKKNYKESKPSKEDYEVETLLFEGNDKLRPRCLKSYLKSDYKTVITEGFSIYAFIFSWIYFIYKKIYLIGLIGLIIAGALVITKKWIIVILYAVISMIISGILFNKLYLRIARKKVDSIIKKTDNPKDAIILSKKAGGENVLLALTTYFIFLSIIIFFYLTGGKVENYNDPYWKENSANKATCLSMIESAKTVTNTYTVAFLREAGCIVVDSSQEKYHLYLKFDTGDRIVIEKHVTTIGEMKFYGSTNLLLEYESRKYQLTESELKYYNEMLNIQSEYDKLVQQANQEVEKGKENPILKNYFVFPEEEVNR